ncbi:MAG: DNA polymerase III subunit epsilon [Proteobacteria bacterium]|nr:DNA polymerase III subunit epsilon [Pseudomonadota bacterium]
MREVVFDTETTGFGVEEHRVIEIGCVELVNRLPTGRTFHSYLNPERAIDYDSQKIHGITDEKVKDAPRFGEIAEGLLAFFADSPLVAHNAEFDFSFVNRELARCNLAPLANEMRDSLALAKKKLPGQRHNLDALCRYYSIDLSARTYHGALLDAQLLADVYVELTGGLQGSMQLEAVAEKVVVADSEVVAVSGGGLVVEASEAEKAAHGAFMAKFVPGGRWE